MRRKPKSDAVMGCPYCGGTVITEFTEFVTVRGRAICYFDEDGSVLTYEDLPVTWSEEPLDTLRGYLEMRYPDAVEAEEIPRTYYRCEECGGEFNEPKPL